MCASSTTHFVNSNLYISLESQILEKHLEPLADQQLMGICNLQQSSQQAEDALSHGMEALQQSLLETLSSTTQGPTGSGNVADYMGQMAIAMGKLATLENFLHQVRISAFNDQCYFVSRLAESFKLDSAKCVVNKKSM